MFEKIKELLVEEMNISAEDITLEAELVNDLGFNSLELADLVVMCEERFDVEFEEKDLPSLITVGDVASYIENQQ